MNFDRSNQKSALKYEPLTTSKPPFIPEYLSTLNPYVPGKPIEETQREFGLKKVVKLASNENPLGPSPKAIEAVRRELKSSQLYPDAGAIRLKQALSRFYGFLSQEISVGNGSNELIEFLIRTFCSPGHQILTSRYAFIAYKISAQAHGVLTLETPMQKDMQFDLDAMLIEVKRQHALGKPVRLIFIANPNNPTGTLLSRSKLNWFLKEIQSLRTSQGFPIVVIDSAYDEYLFSRSKTEALDHPDWRECVRDFENVVVLKTFSKIYGLAGLRIGIAISSQDIIAKIERVRMPFNVSSLALVAAEAALKDQTFVRKSIKVNTKGMKQWMNWLNKNEIPFWKSSANFILIDTQMRLGCTGQEVFQELLKLGVILRPVGNYGLHHALRISIGTQSQNQFAIKAFERAFIKRNYKKSHRKNG